MCTESSVTLLTDADGRHLCGDYGLKKSEQKFSKCTDFNPSEEINLIQRLLFTLYNTCHLFK